MQPRKDIFTQLYTNMQQRNVLIFTDIGDDIDDSLALTYCLQQTQLNIIAIVTWWPPAEKQHALEELLNIVNPHHIPPTYLWSTSAHEICTTETIEKILSLLPATYDILSLWPVTDIVRLLSSTDKYPDTIYLQGSIEDGKPDLDCYNFEQDPLAAELLLTYPLTYTRADRALAYQHGITHTEFAQFADQSPIGTYLYEQALYRQDRFKQVNPSTYDRIYGNNDILSYPYDLLAAIALVQQQGRVQNDVGSKENILTYLYK